MKLKWIDESAWGWKSAPFLPIKVRGRGDSNQYKTYPDSEKSLKMAAINADQLQQLLQAARGGRKPELFSSGDSLEWINWRSHFITCVRINGWQHKRARLEIEACLTGAAKTRSMDIVNAHRPQPAVAEANVPNYTLMLDALEARFLPAAASDLARSTFRLAKQTENESPLDFHGRLRMAFRRAYPNIPEEQVDGDHNLIDVFCAGLLNPEVRSDTIKQRPQTYGDALTIASNMAAAAQIIANEYKTEAAINALATGRLPDAVNALDAEADVDVHAMGSGCYCCGADHAVRDCAVLTRARSYLASRGYHIQPSASRGGQQRGGASRGARGRPRSLRSAEWSLPTAGQSRGGFGGRGGRTAANQGIKRRFGGGGRFPAKRPTARGIGQRIAALECEGGAELPPASHIDGLDEEDDDDYADMPPLTPATDSSAGEEDGQPAEQGN